MSETEKRLALLRGATYPGMATMRWAADEIERLQAQVEKLERRVPYCVDCGVTGAWEDDDGF